MAELTNSQLMAELQVRAFFRATIICNMNDDGIIPADPSSGRLHTRKPLQALLCHRSSRTLRSLTKGSLPSKERSLLR